MDVTLDPDLDLATLKNNFNIISQSVNHVPWNVSYTTIYICRWS